MSRGGRVSPHVMRSVAFTARQRQQMHFQHSQNNLTSEVRANVRELTGAHVRALVPQASPQPKLTKSEAWSIIENMSNVVDGQMETMKARKEITDIASTRNDAARAQLGHFATGLGAAKDIDGNVIQVDKDDRPYVRITNGEIVYVKVYGARITPKGINLDAVCTIANPDGKQEVLLVEPLPMIEKPEMPSF